MSDSCDPMGSSPPSSSVYVILQARILSGLPFPSPGDLPDPGIKPRSPALEADALTSEPPGKPLQVEEGFEILYYLQGAEQIYAHRILGIKFTNQSCQTPQYASFTGYSSSFIGKPFLRCPRRGKLQRRYTFQTKTVANCSNSSQLNDTT